MQKKQNRNRPKPRKIQKKKISNLSPSPHNKVEEGAQNPPAEGNSKTQSEKTWQAQYEALNNKYQFLLAEYANYKKNNLKQMENLRKYEGQHLIQQLLTKVIDSFERALEQELNQQNIPEFKKGIYMIYENLKSLLKETGVKEVPCKGQPFDPAMHCALDSAPSTEIPPEHVLYVIKKPYFLHDKLIRPAEVIVSKKNDPKPLEQNKETSEQ